MKPTRKDLEEIILELDKWFDHGRDNTQGPYSQSLWGDDEVVTWGEYISAVSDCIRKSRS